MSRILAFSAVVLLLVAGGVFLALRAAPRPEPAAAPPAPRPRWGSVALGGAVMRYRPEDGGALEVIYARRDADPELPRAWIRAHPAARIAAWPADGAVLRRLYRELDEGGFFALSPGLEGPGPERGAALAVFDGQRCFTAAAEGSRGAAFAAALAAFERAAAQASGG